MDAVIVEPAAPAAHCAEFAVVAVVAEVAVVADSAVVAVVAVFLTVDAWAQAQGRGRSGFSRYYQMSLLGIEKVQKELGLSEDQIKNIQTMQDAAGANRGQRERGQQLSAEERQKRNEETRKRSTEQQEKLAKILSEDQANRLNQIYVQVAGMGALRDPTVAEKLGLSEAQSTKIQEASDNMRTKMRELFQTGDREQARAKMSELRKQADDDTLAVLTDDQKKMFAEMKGKPFELSPGALRGGRGGAGGGGRGGGGGGGRPGAANRPDRPGS